MNAPLYFDGETIAAIATPPGRGGIGIIRLSGKYSQKIAQQITHKDLQPRHAQFTKFRNQMGTVLDSGITLFFPGPASFTGEDVVELQGHGGPVILDLLLKECCSLGARMARPGEFSERAYLNNKIDLAQAEAIADLINSTTEKAALNASRSLQGEFSKKIEDLVTAVTRLRVYVEAAIDFPEEEIDFIGDGVVAKKLQEIIEQLGKVEQQAKQGSLVQEGMKLVIAGRPNAGKSSLLNALSGNDIAIVTAIEGTTRDVLREHIQIDGMPLHIVDTAGLRESTDEIEQEGIRRAWKEMESADCILLVVDGSQKHKSLQTKEDIWPQGSQVPLRDIPITVIHNKCDISGKEPELDISQRSAAIHLSAKTGAGVPILIDYLKSTMGYTAQEEGHFSARRRHLQSLADAYTFLHTGQMQLLGAGAGELLAEDLRQCQNSLGEITGAITSDELLGEIFSNFCIGK
jgi:tRNA modification GTPase